MGEIMKAPKGVKSGVPERVRIFFCPHVAPIMIYLYGNQSCVAVDDQQNVLSY